MPKLVPFSLMLLVNMFVIILGFIHYSVMLAPDLVVRVTRDSIGTEGPDPRASRHPVKVVLRSFIGVSMKT